MANGFWTGTTGIVAAGDTATVAHPLLVDPTLIWIMPTARAGTADPTSFTLTHNSTQIIVTNNNAAPGDTVTWAIFAIAENAVGRDVYAAGPFPENISIPLGTSVPHTQTITGISVGAGAIVSQSFAAAAIADPQILLYPTRFISMNPNIVVSTINLVARTVELINKDPVNTQVTQLNITRIYSIIR